MPTPAERLDALRNEIGALSEQMAHDALAALNHAQALMQAVADNQSGRASVSQDASRISLMLKREAPAFAQIMDKGQ